MAAIHIIHAAAVIIGMLLMPGPALAHSPYFTQTEGIALPDGGAGEIRLLRGDGIMRSDPVRAVIVDAQGRALARTPQSQAMVIRCDAVRRCKVYDLDRLAVSTPDPAGFRVGGLISDEDERWKLEGGGDSWGFATKRMSLGDAIAGHAAYLTNNKFHAVLPLLFTGLAVTFVLGVLRPAPSRRLRDRIAWYAIGVAAFGIAGLFLLMSLLALWVSGLPLQLWFALSTLGALAVGLLFYAAGRRSAAQRA